MNLKIITKEEGKLEKKHTAQGVQKIFPDEKVDKFFRRQGIL